MVLTFLRYDLGRNSHENRVTTKKSPKWQFVVTSIDQRDVVWLVLESGYASWNLGHLQQKAEIKLRAKTILDLVSNVSSMDMLRPKSTKLLLKVTAERSLDSVQVIISPNYDNTPKKADDHFYRPVILLILVFITCNLVSKTTFKQLTLEQAIPLDQFDPSQVPNALNEFTQKLTSASADLAKAKDEIGVDVHSPLTLLL
ncbi:hypothetical protein Tco_0080192 [Tanacetum coccineum]